VQGFEEAQKNRDIVVKLMTRDQIAEAERRPENDWRYRSQSAILVEDATTYSEFLILPDILVPRQHFQATLKICAMSERGH
jgi:hypothetical protein